MIPNSDFVNETLSKISYTGVCSSNRNTIIIGINSPSLGG